MARKRSTATRRQESEAASARAAAIREQQERRERRRRSLVVTGVGVVVIALVVVIFTIYRQSQDSGDTSSGGSSGTPAGVGAGYAIPVGSSSAPLKVTIYEDFLCPFCGQLEAATRDTLQQGIDDGKVQVRYKVLNFLSGSTSTDYSLRSANAMAVVLDTSGSKVAKKFHDELYENQPQEGGAGLSDDQLVDYAVQAGADKGDVTKGVEDQQFKKWVAAGTDQASKDGVRGTPTVQIDGKQVQGSSVQDIADKIDQAVAAAG